MKLKYLLLDVFTTDAFKGTPLAIVTGADGLLDNEMQAIASEFNLAETAFLTKPRSERNTAAVRIFTPRAEMSFAGHPTIGAAIILGKQHKVPVVRIEERVGLITALIEKTPAGSSRARFNLPHLPEQAGTPPDRHDIALALGILPSDVGCGLYKPAVYTAGTSYYLVPVKNAKVLRDLVLERRGWHEIFPLEQHAVYVFTETPEEHGNTFAARMFAPGAGFAEEPGTGSAVAALVGLVSMHTPFADGQAEYFVRQGQEMGRPCRISMQVRKDAGMLTYAGIGGEAVVIGQGELDFG